MITCRQKCLSHNEIFTLSIKADGRDDSIRGSATKMWEAVKSTCCLVSRLYLLKWARTIRALPLRVTVNVDGFTSPCLSNANHRSSSLGWFRRGRNSKTGSPRRSAFWIFPAFQAAEREACTQPVTNLRV